MVKDKVANLAKERVAKKKIKQLSYGVIDSLMNILLYSIYITFSLNGKSGPAGVHYAFDKADEIISEFNATKLRNALYNLRQKGFIKTLHREITKVRITKTGLERLKNALPFYDEKRSWDKNIYIITYDIPTNSNRQRDILRENLKQLKATKLQDSVYLTVYNPREAIKHVTEEYNIHGQILISTLDTYNAFGSSTDIKDILWDLYDLDDINEHYDLFIHNYKHLKPKEVNKKRQRMKIAFHYLSILKDDPQLPFELLPDKYLGDEAYLLFQKLLGIKL